MKSFRFFLLFIMAFYGIQGLKFRDMFEVQYLLNIAKTTMVNGRCGFQKLDPKGTFFNDAESISQNFCKLSSAQQKQIGELYAQIEEKWKIAQQSFCHGSTIEYPAVDLSVLFNGLIQTGSTASINGLNIQDNSSFWEYAKKGMCVSYFFFNKYQHF